MPSSSSSAIADEELINAPYYHGFQTRYEAEPLLRSEDGSFLVRLVQEDDEFIFVVSVYWKGYKHHYRFYQTEHKNFYYLTTTARRTIPSLIRFHRTTQKPVNEESGARIRRFVERTHYALYREQVKIEQKIGCGNFGDVYRGKLRLGLLTTVDVAVKMMMDSTKRSVNPHERITFLREANLMMRLQHRNIIRFYGCVIYNDPILIVMEFAPGGALLNKLMSTKDPPNDTQRLNYCRDICYGMAYLEKKHVIHRDLAVRNCLLSKNDCVKITDFGLSLVGRLEIIAVGRAPIRYIPPETLKQGCYSNKTDMWSYGVVLFEIWSKPYVEPYHKVQNNTELITGLKSGKLRLSPPKGMPKTMVNLMKSAHLTDPEQRPTFAKVRRDYFGREGFSLSEFVSDFLSNIVI